MSAFNVVSVAARCPACHEAVRARVQFKYGDTWQHEYRVGERLRWGGNDQGVPGRRRVVVDGAAEQCPHCRSEAEWDFYVLLEHDVIVSVEPASGAYRFPPGETFLILE